MTSTVNWPNGTATSTAHCPTPNWTDFVDALANRIASFDKDALAETKRLVDINSLLARRGDRPGVGRLLGALQRPAAQLSIRTLFERGFHEAGDVETRLGYHIGLLGADTTAAQ